jgi:hypothetical protein
MTSLWSGVNSRANLPEFNKDRGGGFNQTPVTATNVAGPAFGHKSNAGFQKRMDELEAYLVSLPSPSRTTFTTVGVKRFTTYLPPMKDETRT